MFSVCFVNPQVYENVGLDRREAVAQVKASGHRAEVMQSGAKRLTDFFDDIGLLNGVGRRLWRSSGPAEAYRPTASRLGGMTSTAAVPPPRATYRRLSVEERRAQLLLAALGLFAHRAPDEVSLDEVAVAAGVSRPLVYRYFPGGRQQLYEAALGSAADELTLCFTEPPVGPPTERVARVLDRYLRCEHRAAPAPRPARQPPSPTNAPRRRPRAPARRRTPTQPPRHPVEPARPPRPPAATGHTHGGPPRTPRQRSRPGPRVRPVPAVGRWCRCRCLPHRPRRPTPPRAAGPC
ncbi:hypothetical protein SBADM41S_09135 [Streptomyces badius]